MKDKLFIEELMDFEFKVLMASGFGKDRRLFSCYINSKHGYDDHYFKVVGKGNGTLLKTTSLKDAVDFFNDTEGVI